MFASIHSWWTVLLLLTFIGIVVWAYSGARKKDFDEAAQLPFDDDDEDSRTHIRDSSRSSDGDGHG